MSKRGPDDGYGQYGEKGLYRRQAWNAIADWTARVGRVKAAHAILMPSTEAHEVAIAEAKGFRRCNLHAIDFKTAIAATISRKYPGIDAKSGMASDACARLADEGVRVTAANFDFCGRVGNPYMKEVLRVGMAPIWGQWAVVGFNALSGREDSKSFGALSEIVTAGLLRPGGTPARGDDLLDTDVARMNAICTQFGTGSGMGYGILRYGKYRSTAGSQRMLWVVAMFWEIEDALRRFAARRNRGDAVLYDAAEWMSVYRPGSIRRERVAA